LTAGPGARLAEALVDARRAQERHARGGPRFEGLDPRDVATPRDAPAAYAVQHAVAEELGWFASRRPSAWKVGAPTRKAMPEATPLPPAGVVASGATLTADRFTSIGIEGELAFRLRAAPRLAAARSIADAAASEAIDEAIGELVVTIEIVAPRFRDLAVMPPLLRLADQGVHGALVVGTGIVWSRPIDWPRQVATVRRDGVVVAETQGGHPLGDLRYLVGWLAHHAASRGHPLAAGDLVTAGTWTGLVPARAGEVVAVEFPGIGEASVTLA
jgi:2-keto-4-pentenoate hydratase